MKKSILFTVLALLVMVSCTNVLNHNGKQEEAANGGVLSIKVKDNVSRTILPDISMDIAWYKAVGIGPGGGTFNETFTGSGKQIENLAPGPWSVIVDAFNEDDILIGRGSGSVTILPNEPSSINITVRPLDGHGTLNLSLYWNSADVTVPQVQSTLTPYSGSVRNLAFTVGDGSAQFSASNVDAGYHTLILKLLDNGGLAMGAVEVVRIVADQVTNGTFTFDDINKARGTLYVEITPEMADPLEINISGGAGIKSNGDIMNLTASTTNFDGNVTYVWYVNGDSVGTGVDFTFDSTWKNGSYRIDVTGFSADGKRGGSASLFVKVQGEISGDFSPASWFTYSIANDEVTIIGLSSVWNALDDPAKNYLVIPESIEGVAVRVIGVGAFVYNNTIVSVDIPDSVITIGLSAFEYCSNLISLRMPNSVIYIGLGLVANCNSLLEITISASIERIYNHSFYNCGSLVSVTIPDSVITIGEWAFFNCQSLTSVILNPLIPPELDGDAFGYNAPNRTFFVPPDSVEAYKTASGWEMYADWIVSQ